MNGVDFFLDTPIGALLLIQVLLIAVNAFFAAAEIVAASTSGCARCSARPDGNQFPFQVPTTTTAIRRKTDT